MYSFLSILLLIDAVFLIAAVLLQAGKGGGLAANFGGSMSSPDSFIGTRQAGNLLTKATWWCGSIFIFLAFVLQLMSTRSRVPTSILDQAIQAPAPVQTAPQTAVPLQPAPQSGAPAQTTAPAPTTTTPPKP